MKRQGDRRRIPKGLITELAAAYGCNSRSIQRIGVAFRAQIMGPGLFDLHRHYQGNYGRPPNPVDKVREKVMAITPNKWQTIRELAAGTGMLKSTLFRHLQGLGARRMARWIKPCLSQEQKLARLQWIVGHIQKVGRKWEFFDFVNTIHIDEKWFFVMKNAQRV